MHSHLDAPEDSISICVPWKYLSWWCSLHHYGPYMLNTARLTCFCTNASDVAVSCRPTPLQPLPHSLVRSHYLRSQATNIDSSSFWTLYSCFGSIKEEHIFHLNIAHITNSLQCSAKIFILNGFDLLPPVDNLNSQPCRQATYFLKHVVWLLNRRHN